MNESYEVVSAFGYCFKNLLVIGLKLVHIDSCYTIGFWSVNSHPKASMVSYFIALNEITVQLNNIFVVRF